jgi:tripartite-type tricarboxylate transporter receptor subunit TctC
MSYRWKSWLGVLPLCLGAQAAQAAELAAPPFPTRTVEIVVGFSPGGFPDIAARFIAPTLSTMWNQPVVVRNLPGGGSSVAARQIAASTPDGHAILSTTAGHSAAPALYSKLGYDPATDFAGVAVLGTTPLLLVVAQGADMRSLKDLIERAKARPGQVTYASAGIGSNTHFAMEVLRSQAGIDLQHIPYKGIPEALTDVMTGRVAVFAAPLGNALAMLKSGKLQALATTRGQRSPLLPDVPTVAESGMNYVWETWFGLLVTATTPRPLVNRLHADIARALTVPAVAERWASLGAETSQATPEQFDRTIREEIATFTRSARAANIQPE